VITEVVGLTQGRIAQIINSGDFAKINNFIKQGKTAEDIAEVVGLTQNRISQIINSGDFAKIDKFIKQGKTAEEIAKIVKINPPKNSSNCKF